MNKVIMTGRLGKPVELRHTQQGTPQATFSLAVDKYSKGGEKKTDWFDFVAWRNTAEFLGKYGSKGRLMEVVGRLDINEWTDKNGNKRRSYQVNVDEAKFLDSAKTENKTEENADDDYFDINRFEEIEDKGDTLPF